MNKEEKDEKSVEKESTPEKPKFKVSGGRLIIEHKKIAEKMKNIKHKIVIMSGKGGVGKTTVAVNLAFALAWKGYQVGILDADIHGPDVPKMLGVEGQHPMGGPMGIFPVIGPLNIKVMSMELLLKDPKTPIIWRGPLKMKVIEQFLSDVIWTALDFLVVDLPPGCLSSSTLIDTTNGPIPISEVKPGMKVYSYNSGKIVTRKVLDVIPQGIYPVYRLRTTSRVIEATPNHPFLKYHRRLYWVKLSQLKAGDRILVVKRLPDGEPYILPQIPRNPQDRTNVDYPRETTPDLMRILGFFLGDGFIHRDRTSLRIEFCEPKDGKFRSKYKQLLKKVFNCHVYEDERRLIVFSKRLATLFQKLGLTGHAKQKRIPSWVFNLPTNQKLAFIEGYCDADGCWRDRVQKRPFGTVKSSLMAFCSTNSMLITQLKELCISSGLRVSNIRKRERTVKLPSGKTISAMHYEFEAKQYDRKRASNKLGAQIERIKSIEFAGYKEVWDLQVEGDHNFVAQGIIVHNTGDEPLSIMQLIPELDGIIIVTTPQDVALLDVKKAITMAKQLNVRVLGVIENMAGFICPHCGKKTYIFGVGGGEEAAKEMNVPFLGRLPLDMRIREVSDQGKPFIVEHPDSEAAKSFMQIVEKIEEELGIKS
nr:P-loop NTPase [Candidatus Baldrarchaeota archaeon]